MSWTRTKSATRIQQFMQGVPVQAVTVSRFDAAMLTRRRLTVAATKSATGRAEDLVFHVKPSEAVLVDGVHVYVQLLDYHDKMLERERETVAGHTRVLGMLHLHYGACDTISERWEAQRVDYHGPRKHSVIVSPAGPGTEVDRVIKALAFADALKRTIEEASRSIGGGQFATRVRIGIDSGMAVAVNSGRGIEPEPLFLGSPANYAAKLAEGDEEGIFLSDRVRSIAGFTLLHAGLDLERKTDVAANLRPYFAGVRASGAFSDADTFAAVNQVKSLVMASYGRDVPDFAFHHHEPPLRSIDFAEVAPSRSIRMDLASIFADLSGFTKYVDASIAQGRVAEMVANLHVLRKELAATLREDFGGKKVRFIGDCVHGLLAEGTRFQTDASGTVKAAVHAAGGLRSSFELCQVYLSGIQQLGLAIGIEYGPTPRLSAAVRFRVQRNRSRADIVACPQSICFDWRSRTGFLSTHWTARQ